ncbi:MAG: hypothetical protein IJW10_03390 [Clostridia bacterium]|nr:hypothetical protein [Clostridia bacterium]
MTLDTLKRLHALNKEIEYEKSRLYSFRKRSDHLGIAGIGSIRKSDYANEIKALEVEISAHLNECLALYKEIMDFINAIPDPLLRLALSLKYINGLDWEQVAVHIGGGNSPDAIRKCCERYLKHRLADKK